MKAMIALLSGALFGAGLTWSGMASPAKVLGFLTLAPGWDPSLLLVMTGALTVTIPGFWAVRRRSRPWLADQLSAPVNNGIDAQLLAGAALFGAGWGLAGYCPGPAIVGAGFLQPAAIVFLSAMLGGAAITRLGRRWAG